MLQTSVRNSMEDKIMKLGENSLGLVRHMSRKKGD